MFGINFNFNVAKKSRIEGLIPLDKPEAVHVVANSKAR